MRDILLQTNLLEVICHIYHFIEELFNLNHYWWRSSDVAVLFISRSDVMATMSHDSWQPIASAITSCNWVSTQVLNRLLSVIQNVWCNAL